MTRSIDTTAVRDAICGRRPVRADTPDIPLEMAAVTPIIVGRPRGEALPGARNEPRIVVWR